LPNGDVNGDETAHSKSDVIVITGKPENCEAAKQALQVGTSSEGEGGIMGLFLITRYLSMGKGLTAHQLFLLTSPYFVPNINLDFYFSLFCCF